jgi:uncharacterized protein (DUF58 family)
MQVANQKHDLIGIQVYDPGEKNLPDVGLVKIHDAETDETFWLDTTSDKVRTDYSRRFNQRMEEFQKDCLRKKLDIIPIETGSDFVEPLMRYFRLREKRF